jgi:hypothetical protein
MELLDVMSRSGSTPESGQATKSRQPGQAKQPFATRNESEETQEAKEPEKSKPTKLREGYESVGQGRVVLGRHLFVLSW